MPNFDPKQFDKDPSRNLSSRSVNRNAKIEFTRSCELLQPVDRGKGGN